MSFSESAGFSIMWAWRPPEWHHAQFFHDSRSSSAVLSRDVSLVSEIFQKGDENFKSLQSGWIYMEDPVVGLSFVQALQGLENLSIFNKGKIESVN